MSQGHLNVRRNTLVAQRRLARLAFFYPVGVVKYVQHDRDIARSGKPIDTVLGEGIKTTDMTHDDHRRIWTLSVWSAMHIRIDFSPTSTESNFGISFSLNSDRSSLAKEQ